MSPLPTRMRDRWKNRPEPPHGQGAIYWHMLLGEHPEARAAGAEAAGKLTAFTGFHLTPPERLHVTTLRIGTAEEVTREHMAAMIAAAHRELSTVRPTGVALERVLYHPEAIVLAVQPSDALYPVLRATRAATYAATGRCGKLDGPSAQWVPHVTVAYSTGDQPAEPLIAALGKSISRHCLTIGSVSLVVQWGPERRWDWECVGTVPFGAGPPAG